MNSPQSLPCSYPFFFVFASFAVACSNPSTTSSSGAGTAAGVEANRPEPGDPDGAGPGPNRSRPTSGTPGIVIIDTQRVFFDRAGERNPTIQVSALTSSIGKVFELAGTKRIPFFITFEDSKSGSHALPAALQRVLPEHAKDFVKTTFGAMGQPQFGPALESSGVGRFFVFGAETDVCVLQTILGMRKAGLPVIAVTGGLFTETVNDRPALRRMRRAGVVTIDMPAALTALETGGPTPSPPASEPPAILRPLETGVVLHDVRGLTASDPNSAAKRARMKELLLLTEWFRLPVLAEDPAATLAALPSDLRSLLTRPIVPLSARPENVTQVAVAGGNAGLAEALTALEAAGDVFLVEDALFGINGADLDPLYDPQAHPKTIATTYKSLYYELTVSVDDREWPSQQWVADAETYYDLTKAPEDLPHLTLF